MCSKRTRLEVGRSSLHCIGAVRGGQHDDGVSAQPTRHVRHFLGDVLAGGEVDEVLCSRLQDQVFLAPGVDPDDSQPDAAGGDLGRQVAETLREKTSDRAL